MKQQIAKSLVGHAWSKNQAAPITEHGLGPAELSLHRAPMRAQTYLADPLITIVVELVFGIRWVCLDVDGLLFTTAEIRNISW